MILGVGFLSGARLGPRRIREVSTHYARGDEGFYDPETQEQFLAAPIKIVDCGDADVLHGDIEYSFESIEKSVRKATERSDSSCHGRRSFYHDSNRKSVGMSGQ